MRPMPLLRLLASKEAALTETLPRHGARKLESLVGVTPTIYASVGRWSPCVEAVDKATKLARLSADLEVSLDHMFDRQDSLWMIAFARILQVALCDPRRARFLRHFHRRSLQGVRIAHAIMV